MASAGPDCMETLGRKLVSRLHKLSDQSVEQEAIEQTTTPRSEPPLGDPPNEAYKASSLAPRGLPVPERLGCAPALQEQHHALDPHANLDLVCWLRRGRRHLRVGRDAPAQVAQRTQRTEPGLGLLQLYRLGIVLISHIVQNLGFPLKRVARQLATMDG